MMDDFPFNYKFIGNSLYANDSYTIISRNNDGLLIIFGDVGGMVAFLSMFIGFFISPFGALRVQSLLAKYLFKQDDATAYTKV